MDATAHERRIVVPRKPSLNYRVVKGNEGVEQMVRGVRLRDVYRTLNAIAQIESLKKGNLDLHNDQTIERLGEESDVVVYLHGIGLSGAIFTPAIPLARARGYKLLAPTYKNETNPQKVLDAQVKPILEAVAVKGARVAGVVGHSTGADHFRYGLLYDPTLREHVQANDTKVVLSAPNTNGAWVQNAWQHLLKLIGQWHDIDNMSTSKGVIRNSNLKKPLPVEIAQLVYTVACTRDRLMPPHMGTDPFGTNIIVENEGHVLGCMGEAMNNFYLDIIDGTIQPQP